MEDEDSIKIRREKAEKDAFEASEKEWKNWLNEKIKKKKNKNKKGWMNFNESIRDMRTSAWCCISCGMPFNFMEESQDFGGGGGVYTLTRVCRVVRMGMQCSRLPFTQWCHTKSNLFSIEWNGNSYYGGNGFFEQESTDMLKTFLRNDQTIKKNIDRLSLGYFINKEFNLCQGCSLLSDDMLNSMDDKDGEVIKKCQNLADNGNITDSIIYISCMHILATFSKRRSNMFLNDEAASWRLECLGRLYLGYMIHTLARGWSKGYPKDDDSPAVGFPNISDFELWYMYAFHPLIEYEEVMGMHTLSEADFTFNGGLWSSFDSQDVIRNGQVVDFSMKSLLLENDHAIMSSFKRALAVCKTYPFIIKGKYNNNNSSKVDQETKESLAYFHFARTSAMISLSNETGIPPPPLCVKAGFPGYLLLERLRVSTSKGNFRSQRQTLELLNDYMNGSLYETWIPSSNSNSNNNRRGGYWMN